MRYPTSFLVDLELRDREDYVFRHCIALSISHKSTSQPERNEQH